MTDTIRKRQYTHVKLPPEKSLPEALKIMNALDTPQGHTFTTEDDLVHAIVILRLAEQHCSFYASALEDLANKYGLNLGEEA